MKIRCPFCEQFKANWGYSLESFYSVRLMGRPRRIKKSICTDCAYDRDEIIAFDFADGWESKDGTFGAGGNPEFVERFRQAEKQAVRIREQVRTGQRLFRAKYPGICIECDGRFEIGELIYFQEREGAWHQNCASAKSYGYDVVEDTIKQPDETILTTGRKFRLVR